MPARHHSPLTGRFLSVDPVGGDLRLPQSWNRYAYVLGNPLNYVDLFGFTECREKQRADEGTEIDCEDEVDASTEDPEEVDLAFLLEYEELKSEFEAFQEHSASSRIGHSGFNYSGMSFQQHLELGSLMGQGGDCSDPNCLMMVQTAYDFQKDPLLWTIGVAQAAGLGFIVAVEAAPAVGPVAANAAQRTGRFLFGKGGLLNSNRYLRIGYGGTEAIRFFEWGTVGSASDRKTSYRPVERWPAMSRDGLLRPGDVLTEFQNSCGGGVERLLRANNLPFRREIEGEEEKYLLFTVEGGLALPLRIFVYDDEAGYFLGREWHIWEAPDHDRAEDLERSFLSSLGSVLEADAP